jgi:hypothetical protein
MSAKWILSTVAAGFLLLSIQLSDAAEGSALDTNVFSNATTGFTIRKPEAWRFASNEEVNTNRSLPQASTKELDQLLRKNKPHRLVVITKYPEPNDELNPTVSVIVRPLGELEGKSAVQVMRAAIGALQNVMKDVAFVEPIQATKVGGLAAGYAKITYTSVSPKGREFKPLSRMWVVPREGYMFMISMAGPREGKDVSEEEFKEILELIRIE